MTPQTRETNKVRSSNHCNFVPRENFQASPYREEEPKMNLAVLRSGEKEDQTSGRLRWLEVAGWSTEKGEAQ